MKSSYCWFYTLNPFKSISVLLKEFESLEMPATLISKLNSKWLLQKSSACFVFYCLSYFRFMTSSIRRIGVIG